MASDEYEQEKFDRPLESVSHGNKTLGVIVMCLGLFGVFFFGTTLELFEKPITFESIGFYLFYLSIFRGCFGVLISFINWRMALIGTICLAAIFLLFFIAGKNFTGEI